LLLSAIWQTDFLRLYSTYVNNYPAAIQTLQERRQECPQFAQFLHKIEQKPECGYQDLQSLLIQPIQRIPRYEMLLLVPQRPEEF
jgi:protein subunit release factor A